MSLNLKQRKNAWVELDLDLLCQNLMMMKSALPPKTDLILVVKANAYGHGITSVAMKAYECGVRRFFVATLAEAVSVRMILPDAIVMLLGAVWASDIHEIVGHRILPVLVSEEQARELAEAARKEGLKIPCHVKVDTGTKRQNRWLEFAGLAVWTSAASVCILPLRAVLPIFLQGCKRTVFRPFCQIVRRLVCHRFFLIQPTAQPFHPILNWIWTGYGLAFWPMGMVGETARRVSRRGLCCSGRPA